MECKTPETLIIGLSGPSCSGKTTIVRLLQQFLPTSCISILHQDNFYVKDSEIPLITVKGPLGSGKLSLQDWESREAFNIPSLVRALQNFRETGTTLPPGQDQPEQDQQPLPKGREAELARAHEAVVKEACEQITSVLSAEYYLKILLVEGILLFGATVPEVRSELDSGILLHTPYKILRERRERRKTYVTLEGFWEDPPGYVDAIVWPTYVAAHKYLFVNKDVEAGSFDTNTMSSLGLNGFHAKDLDSVIQRVCTHIAQAIKTHGTHKG